MRIVSGNDDEEYDLGLAETLIKAGADLEIKDKEGNAALMLAFERKDNSFYDDTFSYDEETVKILLKAGANINAPLC